MVNSVPFTTCIAFENLGLRISCHAGRPVFEAKQSLMRCVGTVIHDGCSRHQRRINRWKLAKFQLLVATPREYRFDQADILSSISSYAHLT